MTTDPDCVNICKHHHTADDIIEALKNNGYYACDIHTNTRGLSDCPKPAIIQTTKGFMVAVKSNTASVVFMDPKDDSIHRLALHDFIKIWTGLVVVIEPRPTRSKSFLEKLFRR
jgi:ABC-type bacteriocin/lantibiotic exporter with double-glycine peptidase domain